MIAIGILGASLLIQIGAASLAIRLIRVSGHQFSWLMIAGAMLLMGARRAISLYGLLGGDPAADYGFLAELVALTISALIFLGLLGIRPLFESQGKASRLQARMGRLLDSSLHEIYMFSAITLRFNRVNRGAQINLGYTIEELRDLTPLDIKPDFCEEEFRKLLVPLFSGDAERARFSTCHRRKDGSEYPVEVDLQLFHEEAEPICLAVIQDVSERQEAERTLADSEAHFRMLIENVHDLITVLSEDGQVVYNSPSVERTLGYRPEERMGRSAFELVHPDDLAKTKKALEQMAVDHGPESLEYRLRHKDGTWLHFETVGQFRENAQGERQIIINQRDVTDRIKTQKQLLQTQRLETIGSLAGGIAHDFNNILMPMLGHTETLNQNLASKKDASAIREILNAIQRARALVGQIMTFSGQSGQQKTPLCLEDVVEEVLGLIRASMPSNITIVTRLKGGIGSILADRTQVHQVIMNLCANARHAMQAIGGTLTIEIDPQVLAPADAVDLPNIDFGSYIRLKISDTGHGMDAQVLDRVFEPFFTTKAIHEGTGMGLSIAHGIMLEHGGDLVAESQPGRGACFQAWFPRVDDLAEPAPLNREKPLKGNERILLLDDERPVVMVIEGMLTGMGYAVTSMTDSQEALDLIGRSPQEFDMVITDQSMPHMSGQQVAHHVKACNENLPVLLMSGYSAGLDSDGLRAMGIAGILAKPFGTLQLGTAIREILDGPPACI